MEWWVYVILATFGYIIYRGLSSDQNQVDSSYQYRRRKTGRGSAGNNGRGSNNNNQQREKESYISSAKRQENMGNYDEASRLYLRAGQVFSAAKMKAMKGPQFANEAVEIVQVNSPERSELITRNLANDFFYRLEQPATAAALLRGLGLVGEAEAVEVAAGITTTQSYQEPNVTASSVAEPSVQQEPEIEINEVPEELEQTPVEEQMEEETGPVDSYPNTMMLASTIQEDKCSVCKREIKSGDSFIYCLNCGKPGHYAHLGEMIKVTGKCPICKKRLTPTMYEV